MELLCIHGTMGLQVVVFELLLIQYVGRVCLVYVHAKCVIYEIYDSYTGSNWVTACFEVVLGLERDMGLFMNTWPCPKEVK